MTPADAGGPSPTGIEVTTGYTTLTVVYAATTTHLCLDGGPPVARPWGATFFPTAPGEHDVRCFFRYTFFAHAGDASVVVSVPPGEVVAVHYLAPKAFAFRPGTWSTTDDR